MEEEELTPFVALNYLDDIAHGRKMSYDAHELKLIIEDALNDNHFYKYMISRICDYIGLDINPFEDLGKTENEIINYIFENSCYRVDVATNKNKLKALEIIKEFVLIKDLVFDDEEQGLNFNFGTFTLCIMVKNKTKYDLLKEVLCKKNTK